MRKREYTKAEYAKKVKEFLDAPAPEGWKKTVSTEYGHHLRPYNLVTLKNDDGVELLIRVSNDETVYFFGDGTTNFTTKLGERTFDRSGVDSSFYLDDASELEGVIAEQLKRVKESRERINNSIKVPGLPGGFLVTEEKRKDISEKLKSGKTHSFAPAGFGTGYVLNTKKLSRWDEVAPKELAEFFGVKSLYLSRFDHD